MSLLREIAKRKNIIAFAVILLSLIIFLNGYRTTNYNELIFSVLLLIIGITLTANKQDVLFVLFLFVFSTFLIGMPLIDAIYGREWWGNGYDLLTLDLSVSILFISVFFLYLGYRVEKYNYFKARNLFAIISKKHSLAEVDKKLFYRLLFIGMVITYAASFFMEIDKLLFMRGKIYEDFYILYTIRYPSIITIIGNLNVYFLIAILAAKPKKLIAFPILLAYVAKTIPMLIIGKRSPFILALLFSFIYYILRDLSNDQEKWIGKVEKVLILVCIPTILVAMTLINYSRSGFQTHGIKVFDYIIDFFYRQGFTFKVHTLGVENYWIVKDFSEGRNYLFGELIDLFKFGRLSQLLFSAQPLPLGNSVFAAMNSSNYAYSLSYLVHPLYLQGHGYGNSYILEAYQTYGIIGVALTNFIVGMILKNLYKLYRIGYIGSFLSLIIIEKIYFIPRASFSSIFTFVFKPSFIITATIMLIIFIFALFRKKARKEIENDT